jgi:hypothetical protein
MFYRIFTNAKATATVTLRRVMAKRILAFLFIIVLFSSP